jgi:hypothetical protein
MRGYWSMRRHLLFEYAQGPKEGVPIPFAPGGKRYHGRETEKEALGSAQKKFAKARGTKPMVHATACPFVSPTPQTADAVEGHNLDCPNPFSGWPF